jgi:hypothetical protein
MSSDFTPQKSFMGSFAGECDEELEEITHVG